MAKRLCSLLDIGIEGLWKRPLFVKVQLLSHAGCCGEPGVSGGQRNAKTHRCSFSSRYVISRVVRDWKPRGVISGLKRPRSSPREFSRQTKDCQRHHATSLLRAGKREIIRLPSFSWLPTTVLFPKKRLKKKHTFWNSKNPGGAGWGKGEPRRPSFSRSVAPSLPSPSFSPSAPVNWRCFLRSWGAYWGIAQEAPYGSQRVSCPHLSSRSQPFAVLT